MCCGKDKTMKGNLQLLLILLTTFLGIPFSESLENSLGRCCNIGVRWGYSNNSCHSYPSPVAGVVAEHQGPCLSTIAACCQRNYRERACLQGHELAKLGKECLIGTGIGGHFQKDCCEGCKLGLVAGSMGLNCGFQSLKIALGPPWDSSLTGCCLQSGGRIPATTVVPTTGRNVCALFPGQLCSQNCIPTGESFKCACNPGYVLGPDAKTCSLDNNVRKDERDAKCPIGFQYNEQTQVCDDLDECSSQIGISACYPYKSCVNTIGSFLCETKSMASENPLDCPPGYRYSEGTCVDIDECLERIDICIREIQYCINTPGGFDCKGKKEFNRYNCPAGYKFNNLTLNCDDVNECLENLHSCQTNGTEVCRNTNGAYECDIQCREGYRFDARHRSCLEIDECQEGTHDCIIDKESCVNVPGSYQCHQLTTESNCPPGFEPNKNFTFLCQDKNECETQLHTCSDSEVCVNEIGGYKCITPTPSNNPEYDETTETNFIPDSTGENQDRFQRKTGGGGCPSGYRLSSSGRGCHNINECLENNPCDSSQHCEDTVGSYYCHCRSGFYRDPVTRSCQDINECQTGQHNCAQSQRCDNTPGSFTCIRITGCGTGYTLNAATGQCEDDDECLFGNHNCEKLRPDFQCKNTLGSFRCERSVRRCPQGLTLAPNGQCRPTCDPGFSFNSRGECVDIDECLSSSTAGRSLCPPNQKCVNERGSFKCMSKTICPAGFEADPVTGSRCVDIDECLVKNPCKSSQVCINRSGGFLCQCPPGYTISPITGECEDIDECNKFTGQICSPSNSVCQNLPGSFRCICKEGFEQSGTDNRTCIDVDECKIERLCEQSCQNTYGSYKCACSSGFVLGSDGRSCRDFDECSSIPENGYLCMGICRNTLGSYQCECPSGYILSPDGRSCQDIDECERPNSCRQDESCLNIKGGFRCNRNQCPHGYKTDGENNDRCKKTTSCLETDTVCMKQPLTISRNYLAFTSNIRIASGLGFIDLFTMRGPNLAGAVLHFNMELKSSRAPGGIAPANKQFFLLRRPTPFQAVISLTQPIIGPQDVELELTMEVYHRGVYAGSALAQIVIVVSSYEY